MKFVRSALVLPLAITVLSMAAPSQAQEKTGSKAGFTLASGSAKIVIVRPSIKVGEQSTGGMFEPNADWTEQARQNLGKAIAAAQGGLGNEVVDFVEPDGENAAVVAEYRNLFSTVADSVITYQFFPGNRLPTKKRDKAFEWTLGPDIGKLPGFAGNDYALFVVTEDQFGSAGRKAAQIFGALAGVSVAVGVHTGYAGLVDLKTGELVWLNADRKMGGDVRTEEGAQKRVAQLLEGFPGRPVAVQTASTQN